MAEAELDRLSLPSWIRCPACRGLLEEQPNGLTCRECGRAYRRYREFLNLLPDPLDRFEDELLLERCAAEENSNTYAVHNYILPLIRKTLGQDRVEAPVILSCGCGVGVDVDLYRDEGLDAYGIDCGERASVWARRRNPERFFIANAKAIPCANATFDFVGTGCLLPHIGVVGDTTQVTTDYLDQRRRAVREIVRVVKPGGYIFLMNPNRLCPADLHHLQPNPDRLARFHSPREPFLLSFADHRRLWIEEAGCSSIRNLPPAGYWGFLQKTRDRFRKFLVPPVRYYTELLSTRLFAPLRSAPLNPWLYLLIRK